MKNTKEQDIAFASIHVDVVGRDVRKAQDKLEEHLELGARGSLELRAIFENDLKLLQQQHMRAIDAHNELIGR